jgi:hypothetical protein
MMPRMITGFRFTVIDMEHAEFRNSMQALEAEFNVRT